MSSPVSSDAAPESRYPIVRRLAWATLAFTVLVILGGSVVRATDSGAGCGESWPRCEGRIVPVSPEGATIIEFTHRVMTVVLGVLMVALFVAVYRHYRKGHRVRRALNWSVGLFLGEVLIGALLVVFGWVEDDASVGRVIAVTVHLINTFLLLGALALTAHYASGGLSARPSWGRSRDRLIVLGVIALLVVAASGALNALADTLFPADSLVDALREEFGPTAPFLVRLRVMHPVVAIAGAGILFMVSRAPSLGGQGRAAAYSVAIQVLLGIQIIAGLVNVALLTPTETQVAHLLFADLLWILWVMFGAEVIGERTARAVASGRQA